MAFAPVVCTCQQARSSGWSQAPREFADLRESCPALRLVLVPDVTWPEFKSAAQARRTDSTFASLLLSAFDRCYLNKFTGPVHRYILDGDAVRGDVRREYIDQLAEVWQLEVDPFEQNRKGRGYLGKLTELQVAEWIERSGSAVTSLEAWAQPGCRVPDVSARSPYGVDCYIEVKYLGREDGDFAALYDAFLGRGEARWYSVDSRANYLLSRVYEAARQLRGAGVGARRLACVVISDAAWGFMSDAVLEDHYINWSAPVFLECPPETGWPQHFETKLKPRYPTIEQDLGEVLRTLHHVWVLSSDTRSEFAMQRVVNLPGT